jgi:hypothetical protein
MLPRTGTYGVKPVTQRANAPTLKLESAGANASSEVPQNHSNAPALNQGHAKRAPIAGANVQAWGIKRWFHCGN